MDLGLKGKNAVVLGGTRGIGRSICETLAQEGANVALCARNSVQVDEAVKAIGGLGVKCVGGSVDISDHARLGSWIGEAGRALGGIDVLISNASALGVGNGADAWRSNFNVDMLGAVISFEAAKPFLLDAAAAKGDASAVFISSVSAAETENANAYGAVKAALIHFGKGLARENAKNKIRVNVVSPGTIYFKGGVWEMVEQSMPDRFKMAMSRNPLGRMGTPQEIANVSVFLASPAASFTTGANVVVDGGITGRVNF